MWWRCGHTDWETLDIALTNPDDYDAYRCATTPTVDAPRRSASSGPPKPKPSAGAARPALGPASDAADPSTPTPASGPATAALRAPASWPSPGLRRKRLPDRRTWAQSVWQGMPIAGPARAPYGPDPLPRPETCGLLAGRDASEDRPKAVSPPSRSRRAAVHTARGTRLCRLRHPDRPAAAFPVPPRGTPGRVTGPGPGAQDARGRRGSCAQHGTRTPAPGRDCGLVTTDVAIPVASVVAPHARPFHAFSQVKIFRMVCGSGIPLCAPRHRPACRKREGGRDRGERLPGGSGARGLFWRVGEVSARLGRGRCCGVSGRLRPRRFPGLAAQGVFRGLAGFGTVWGGRPGPLWSWWSGPGVWWGSRPVLGQ